AAQRRRGPRRRALTLADVPQLRRVRRRRVRRDAEAATRVGVAGVSRHGALAVQLGRAGLVAVVVGVGPVEAAEVAVAGLVPAVRGGEPAGDRDKEEDGRQQGGSRAVRQSPHLSLFWCGEPPPLCHGSPLSKRLSIFSVSKFSRRAKRPVIVSSCQRMRPSRPVRLPVGFLRLPRW
ncbi:hypothetical protein THAOC_28814, partial [Thalassiosira oceanica]